MPILSVKRIIEMRLQLMTSQALFQAFGLCSPVSLCLSPVSPPCCIVSLCRGFVWKSKPTNARELRYFVLSSELKRAISSVQNSTTGARHVWLHLCIPNLRLSFDLWSWHAIGRAWNNFKGHTLFQLWPASRLTHLFVNLNITFFVLLCDVVETSKARNVLPRKQFWTQATECAWKRW